MKLLIDLNSILSASLLVGKDPEGFKVDGQQINSWEYGYNNFLNSYRNILDNFDIAPMHTIGVSDAPKSREKRQRIYKDYKAHRAPRPEEYYEEFNRLMKNAQRFIRHLGGCIVSYPKTEADDVIAYLAPKLDSIIWTRDKDLLSIDRPVYIDGALHSGKECRDHFIEGLPRKYIRLYRTLVSDPGDFGPGMGAAGFGEKAFAKLWAEFGDEGLDNLSEIIEEGAYDELLEDVGAFPALQKIIDSHKEVSTTWRLTRWLSLKDFKLEWQPGFANDDKCETFDEAFIDFYQEITPVDVTNFDSCAKEIRQLVYESDYVALDIETDVSEDSEAWLAQIKAQFAKPPIVVDVIESKLVGLGLTLGKNQNRTFYISVAHADTMNVTLDSVKELVMSLGVPIICHNAGGFELPVLYQNWGVWIPDVYCSQIAASYVDENKNTALKLLSSRYYHYNQVSYSTITDGKTKGMRDVSLKEVLQYGADDTIMTAHLFNFFEMIMDIEGTFDVYADVEQLPMYMVAHAFVHGINWDPDYLADLAVKDKVEADKALAVIHEYLTELEWDGTVFDPLTELSLAEIKRGYQMMFKEEFKTRFRIIAKVANAIEDEEFRGFILADDLDGLNAYIQDHFVPQPQFNPGSVVDKKRLLYETFAFPVRFRKMVTDVQRAAGQREGSPMVDEDAIKWMIKEDADEEQRKLLEALLRWTAYDTRNGLYYQPYKYLSHWKTGKLHPSLKQSWTTSRRFAPAGPNVNQIPKRSEEGKKIRGCIVPHHPDAVLVSPDFSGQELRLGAWATQDENFLACYVGDYLKDLHTITAYEISKRQGNEFKDYQAIAKAIERGDKVANAYRTAKAKPTNFLSQYVSKGGGAWTLSKKLQITEEEANEFLSAKSEAFPGVDQWKETYGSEVLTKGYAETFLGARKHVGAAIIKNESLKSYYLRSSINFKIQSSAAEMTKLVMAEIWRQGLLDMFDMRFYMPVHDELCFSVMLDQLVEFTQELWPIMTQPYADMEIPVMSSLAVGPNFDQLHEIDWVPEEVERWIEQYRGGTNG